jgi:hypothetical protein
MYIYIYTMKWRGDICKCHLRQKQRWAVESRLQLSASRMNSFLFVPLHRVAGAKCEVCLFIDFKSGIEATRGCISGVNIDLLGLCPVSPDANSTKLTRHKKRVGRGRTCRRYVYVIIVQCLRYNIQCTYTYTYIHILCIYIYTYVYTYIYMLCTLSTIQ